MNYTQLDDKKKAQIDVLLENGYSMRKSARMLGISHSTISRYKAGVYQKRKIDIRKKYSTFIDYFYNHYDRRYCSVDVVIHKFKHQYRIKNVHQFSRYIIGLEMINLKLREIHYVTKENGQITEKAV